MAQILSPDFLVNLNTQCCIPTIKTCFTYGYINVGGGTYNTGGYLSSPETKYSNPSYLSPGITSFTHTIVGFYKRPLGTNTWSSNLITSNPTITTPIGTIPNFSTFINSQPQIISNNILFNFSAGGSLDSVVYPDNFEWYIDILEVVNGGSAPNVNYKFGAIQQGGSGEARFGDNFNGADFEDGNIQYGICS